MGYTSPAAQKDTTTSALLMSSDKTFLGATAGRKYKRTKCLQSTNIAVK